MKPILLFLLTALLFATGCNKILDRQPTDFVQPDNYYNSEQDLNYALTGVYDPLGSEYLYGSSLWFQFGSCSDESFYPNTANSFSAPMFYQFDYTNPYVSGLWEQCYIGIERANLLIKNINKPGMDETKRQAILGEALFLRGYYHFLLVSNYGGVPLKLAPTASINSVNIPRDDAATVYAQVLADMKEAEAKVSKASEIGNSSHVSQTTVQGILARVCLYMAGNPLNDQSKYAEALSWAQKVQQSGEHQLNTVFDPLLTNSAYSQVFVNQTRDIYDVKESMWEADFNMNDLNTSYNEGGRLGTYQMGCQNIDTGFGSGNIRTTIKLYNLYQTGDQRRDWSIAPFSFTSNANSATRVYYATSNIIGRESGKWRRYTELPPKQQYRTGTNFPILRYSDVLLMLAEAENEVNAGPTQAAYDAINEVRRRGYGLPLDQPDAGADLPTGLSYTDFKQQIQDERSRELCFEGLRRPDLIRWGIFKQVMDAMVTEIQASNASVTNKNRWILGYSTAGSSPRYTILPIPALELNINKAIRQNQGW